MDKIEVDFTEEEKKSWEENKSFEKNIPQDHNESKIFFLRYDREQKIVFFSLLILLFMISIFTVLTKDAPENIQNNPEEPNNNPSLHLSKKVILEKGDEAPIVDENNNGLKSIFVGVGWTPAGDFEMRMDVDSTVILVDSANKTFEEICYYHLTGPGVKHHGDNLTGENTQTQVASLQFDDENIDVFLNEIPKNYDKIYFVLNIFDATKRRQTLNIVRDMYINIYDLNKNLLMQYLVNENTIGNALVLGVAEVDRVEEQKQLSTNKQYVPIWTFKAIGMPLTVKDIDELCKFCVDNQDRL